MGSPSCWDGEDQPQIPSPGQGAPLPRRLLQQCGCPFGEGGLCPAWGPPCGRGWDPGGCVSRAEPGFTQRHPRGRCRRARDEAVRLIHPRVQRKGCRRSRTRQLREIRAFSIILLPSSSCSCTTGSCPAPWVPTPNPLSLVPGCVLGLGVWPVEPSSCVPLPRGANALLSKSSSSSSSPGRAASACSQCAPSGFVPSYRRGATPWLCQGQ